MARYLANCEALRVSAAAALAEPHEPHVQTHRGVPSAAGLGATTLGTLSALGGGGERPSPPGGKHLGTVSLLASTQASEGLGHGLGFA